MLELTAVRQDHGTEWYESTTKGSELCQLVVLTFGKCVYWVKDQKYILDKGDILYIPAGVSYYGKSIPTLFHTKYVVLWTPTHAPAADSLPEQSHDEVSPMDALTLPLLRLQSPLHLKAGCYDLIHERVKLVQQHWTDRPPYYRIMAATLCMEALVHLNMEWDRGEVTPEHHRHVERMKEYIQIHYRKRITKDDLGDVIQKSPGHAATLLRRVTGRTISEHVHSQRIKTATYMLTESRLNIAEIAEYVGYNDVSYFYRIFKRHMGHPPSEILHQRSSIQ
ncbi:HTH-type transcriptional activator Btr [compost metagenome]